MALSTVYARPYTAAEVRDLFDKGLSVSSVLTHPTISSILPNELFEEEIVRELIDKIDRQLSELTSGAYILVAGGKE